MLRPLLVWICSGRVHFGSGLIILGSITDEPDFPCISRKGIMRISYGAGAFSTHKNLYSRCPLHVIQVIKLEASLSSNCKLTRLSAKSRQDCSDHLNINVTHPDSCITVRRTARQSMKVSTSMAICRSVHESKFEHSAVLPQCTGTFILHAFTNGICPTPHSSLQPSSIPCQPPALL